MVRLFAISLVLASVTLGLAPTAQADMRIGGGIHYLKTLGDIKDTPDFDESAIGFIGGLKYKSGLFTLEGDLEAIPDYGGSDEIMWQPQGYLLLGDLIYGGAGMGIGHLGELGWQDPFYALRAGVDFTAGPLDLDLFASYRFQKAGDLESLGSDDFNSITFGAMAFFGLGGK